MVNWDAVLQLVARLLAFCVAIPVHEAAHAFASDKLGDPTARNLGRLTLNPLKHIDPVGFIAMLVVGIGWAKPVPIDTRYYKNRKKGMALSAAAGPLSNLLMAYISFLLYKVVYFSYIVYGYTPGMEMPMAIYVVAQLLFFFAIINVNLAVFNLLPIPPFDGSRIFLSFLPDKYYFGAMKYERYIMFGVLLLFWFGAFSGILGTLNGYVIQGLDWGTGYINKLFSLLV